MRASNTRYRLAHSPADYRKAHTLARLVDERLDGPMTFPTVLADRDGTVVGVLGSAPDKNFLVAGPLAIMPDLPSKGPVLMRLIEAYENLASWLGIDRVLFRVHTDESSRWVESVSRLYHIEPYAIKDGWAWFERKLA